MPVDHLGSVPLDDDDDDDDDSDGIPDSMEDYDIWDAEELEEYYIKRSFLEKVEDFFEDTAYELEHLFSDAYDETNTFFRGMIDLYKNW